ncbi:hypothetical protein V8E36_003919 [Tilletia maclaganii]
MDQAMNLQQQQQQQQQHQQLQQTPPRAGNFHHHNTPTPSRSAKGGGIAARRRSRGSGSGSGSFDNMANPTPSPVGQDPSISAMDTSIRRGGASSSLLHHRRGAASSNSSSLRDSTVAAALDGGVGSGAARSIPGISGASGPAGAALGNPLSGGNSLGGAFKDDHGTGTAGGAAGAANAGSGSGAGNLHLGPMPSGSGSGSGNAGGPPTGTPGLGLGGGVAGPNGAATISASATAAAAGAIVSDFTKRKGWSMRIVEELLDFVHVLDFGGRILFASPSVTGITGWKPEDLVGKEIVKFIHPNDRLAFVREFERLVDLFLESQQNPQEAGTLRQQQSGGSGAQQHGQMDLSGGDMGKARGKNKGKGKARYGGSVTDSSLTTSSQDIFSEASAGSAITKATTVAQNNNNITHASQHNNNNSDNAAAGTTSPNLSQQQHQPPDMLFYYRFAKKPVQQRRSDLFRTKSLSRLTFADAIAAGNYSKHGGGNNTPGMGMGGGRLPNPAAAALSRSASRFGGSEVGSSGMGEDHQGGMAGSDGMNMSLDGFDGMGGSGIGMGMNMNMGMGMGMNMAMGMGRGMSTSGGGGGAGGGGGGAMSTPGAMKHMTPGGSRQGGGGGGGSDDELGGGAGGAAAALHQPVEREWVIFEVAGHVYVPPSEAFGAARREAGGAAGHGGDHDSTTGHGAGAGARMSIEMMVDVERRTSSDAANNRRSFEDLGPAGSSSQRTAPPPPQPEWPPQDGVETVRCVFCSCRTYPSKNVSMFDSFLELKVENERLRLLLGEAQAAHGGGGGGADGDDWREDDGNFGLGGPSSSSAAGNFLTSGGGLHLAHFDPNDPETPFGPELLAGLVDDVDAYDDSDSSGAGAGLGNMARPHRSRLNSTMLSRGPSVSGLGSGMGSPTSPAGGGLATGNTLEDDDELGGGYGGGGGAMEGSQDDVKRKPKKMRTEEGDHVCTDCGRVDSPEWRKGPLGPKTLCNACGLRWAKKIKRKGGDPNATASAMAQATANAGRLVPTSPTFSRMPN